MEAQATTNKFEDRAFADAQNLGDVETRLRAISDELRALDLNVSDHEVQSVRRSLVRDAASRVTLAANAVGSMQTKLEEEIRYRNYSLIAALPSDATHANGISLEAMGTPRQFCADWCADYDRRQKQTEEAARIAPAIAALRSETYHSHLDDSTYVVRTTDGFAVCDNGEEVVCATAEAAARIVVENARL